MRNEIKNTVPGVTQQPNGTYRARIGLEGAHVYLGTYTEREAAELAIFAAIFDRAKTQYESAIKNAEYRKTAWITEIEQRNDTHRLQMATVKERYWQKLSERGIKENDKELQRSLEAIDKEILQIEERYKKAQISYSTALVNGTLDKPYTEYRTEKRNIDKTAEIKAKENILRAEKARLLKSQSQLLKEKQKLKSLEMKANVAKRKAAKDLQAAIEALIM